MRDEKLQQICREYLTRLYHMAKKHNLLPWLKHTIKENKAKRCEATNKEVELLGRIVDEERVCRNDIPAILGKSYRQCYEDGDFDRIKKLPDVGRYSKLSALLYKEKTKNKKKK